MTKFCHHVLLAVAVAAATAASDGVGGGEMLSAFDQITVKVIAC